MKYLLLFSFAALSASAQDFCRMDVNPPVKRFQLDVQPSYFISADPNGRYVGVISSGNNIYDMEDVTDGRPKSIKVPGSYDPVFTPDGKYLTIPTGIFYDASEVRSAMQKGDASITPSSLGKGDGAAQSPYQSIGVLSQTATNSSYMYLSDVKEGNSSANLEYFVVDVDHTEKTLLTKSKGNLCGNIPEGNTPMVSQDGKYVSILNTATRSTQIYRINLEGSCPMMVDLGIPTGKVSFDFSANPRRLAFHVDRASTNVTWFSGLGRGITKDTYVMDLNVTGAGRDNEKWNVTGVQRLGVHSEESTGTYYPRFRRDGTLVAISVDNEPRTVDGVTVSNTNYYLDVFQPRNGRTNRSYDPAMMLDPFCDNGTLKDKAFAPLALAYLWKNACDQSTMADRYRDSLLLPPSMDHDACVALVDRFWNQRKEAFLNSPVLFDEFNGPNVTNAAHGTVREHATPGMLAFTPAQLKQSCPAERARARGTNTGGNGRTVETSPEQLMMNKCGGCHDTEHTSAGIAFQSGHNINRTTNNRYQGLNADTAQMAMMAIWGDRMPPGGSEHLRDADKKKMTKYLIDMLPAADRDGFQTQIREMGGSW